MKFHQNTARVYVPDGGEPERALASTTHLSVGAHPDDLEFMNWHPILSCFEDPNSSFSGVVVSDGRASPRTGLYAGYSDEEMVQVRLKEQRHAAYTGEYGCVVHLMYREDSPVLAGAAEPLVQDLLAILQSTRPAHIYTHNLADRHPHHLVVALAMIRALRESGHRPQTFLGGEVWRGLDWMRVEDRSTFDVGARRNLTNALMGVYDSQISGGKRYDVATEGRKRANATYGDPLSTDETTHAEYAMDLMPLLQDLDLCPIAFVTSLIDGFRSEVQERLKGLS